MMECDCAMDHGLEQLGRFPLWHAIKNEYVRDIVHCLAMAIIIVVVISSSLSCCCCCCCCSISHAHTRTRDEYDSLRPPQRPIANADGHATTLTQPTFAQGMSGRRRPACLHVSANHPAQTAMLSCVCAPSRKKVTFPLASPRVECTGFKSWSAWTI